MAEPPPFTRPVPLRDGWWYDGVGDDAALPEATRSRFAAYGKPLGSRLYDVDLRVTSKVVWGASLREQAELNRAALIAAARAGRSLLEVPVGTGLVLAKALRLLHGAPPPIVAVDLSVPMLARARSRLGHAATYVRADVGDLPFAEGTFGSVHSASGFHLFPDIEVAARELGRVVAPGGSAAIVTWTADTSPLRNRWMRRLARGGYINEPGPRAGFEQLFQQSGFHQTASVAHGTTLFWTGTR
jgi:ubiquinone/menaquinone biosynthesis C-methylase UbiE